VLKRTPLFEVHKNLGAKIVEFAGWQMPVQYSSIIEEHNAVRKGAGLFDVSHMGRIDVSGQDSTNFVQKLITNDVSKLVEKQALYTPMCYESGTIVDDLMVYKLNEGRFIIVVNASNISKDFKWMEKNREGNVELKDISREMSMLALQGPKSEEVLQKLTYYGLSSLGHFRVDEMKLDEIDAIVSRTGYTGEDGFEIFVDAKYVEDIWKKILQAGKTEGVVPAGLGARDTLRLEAGLMLYGNDIDETTTPLEAPLNWTVKFYKDYFVGKKKLLEQKRKGIERKLVGFEMIGRGIPRHGYEIFVNNDKIGDVTSGTFSPTFRKGIGMGYVDVRFKKVNTKIKIQIRDKLCSANIVKMPLYRRLK